MVRAPAKINLFLEVLGKRPDGYHELATLMVAIRHQDMLCFKEDAPGQPGTAQLSIHHADLSPGPDNLILKAVRLVQSKTGCDRGVTIRLNKRIPMAAGLAGGSTDAAATLQALNRLWNLGRSNDELAQWSSELGSDIPFFFHLPAGWCTGRGEIVESVRLPRPFDLVLAAPPVGCSTPAVYKGVVVPEKPTDGDAIRKALADGDVERLGRLLHNRLEASAMKLCPAVAMTLDKMRRLKPAGQLMSGSGSTVFALCRDRAEAERILTTLRQDPELATTKLFLTRTCSEQAPTP